MCSAVKLETALQVSQVSGGRVTLDGDGAVRRLSIAPGPSGQYRLAQLDNYRELRREAFRWQPPARMSLRARASGLHLAGTWGFGFWNDPFTATLGVGGAGRRMPALPNAAWFFSASPPNYLAFRDSHPAQGLLAATFSSPRLPFWLAAPGVLALPLLLVRPAARALRSLAGRVIKEDAARLEIDPREWHSYALEWTAGAVRFQVDGEECLVTPAAPRGPLGFVLWIDNQYAAFGPDGRVRYGSLPYDEEQWLEVSDLALEGLG